MKRPIIKYTLILMAMAGMVHACWCLHPFLLRAPLRIDPRIPDEAAAIVREMHSERQFNRQGFSWQRLSIHLLHPSRARREALEVKLVAPDKVALEVPGHKPWVLASKDAAGHWKRVLGTP